MALNRPPIPFSLSQRPTHRLADPAPSSVFFQAELNFGEKQALRKTAEPARDNILNNNVRIGGMTRS